MERVQQTALSGMLESRCETDIGVAKGERSNRRASMFRESQNHKRMIEVIDEHGNCLRETKYGWMNMTDHKTIMKALEYHAKEYN
jgi:hypothetical protein